ncbi:haloacid dehalogenase type II [Knoellia sp. CPCC 206435]|uniref:haloacid dehalogenase type II n=1 Tax=Knoellia terrae TaxID=3404797 RepID=UPI003B438EE9
MTNGNAAPAPGVEPDLPVSVDGPRRPRLLVFDVNETLSDMSPMQGRFEDVGAPPDLAAGWFAGLLRDGFALTVAGGSAPFTRLATGSLTVVLQRHVLDRPLPEAVEHVMDGFATLTVHPDVPAGAAALAALGIRLVTLSNGSASVAQGLLGRAGVGDRFEQLLSVEDAGVWKPAPAAYAHALERCGVAAGVAMLVAVHPWDIDGAARAGLATAWVNRDGGTYPGYFSPPDLTCTSLTDLADRLT